MKIKFKHTVENLFVLIAVSYILILKGDGSCLVAVTRWKADIGVLWKAEGEGEHYERGEKRRADAQKNAKMTRQSPVSERSRQSSHPE